MPTNPAIPTTIETLNARLAVLDEFIARTHAAIMKRDTAETYRLDSRPLAFALPVAHATDWEALATRALGTAMVCPGDTRWGGPGARRTVVTGPVDPSVAFAVAMAIGGDL